MGESHKDCCSEREQDHLRRFVALVVLGAVFGCSGSRTTEERSARAKLMEAASLYDGDSGEITTTTPLRDLMGHAVRRSPAVRAAYYDWLQAIERITVERSLPDPRVTFESDIQEAVLSVIPGLMVDLPGPGKRRAQAAVAAGEAEVRGAEFRRALLTSAATFKRSYYELQALTETIAVARRNIRLLSNLQEIARAQYSASRASLQDVLRADIEADELRVRLANLEDSLSVATARYATSLGYLPESLGTPPLPKSFENSHTAPDLDDIYTRARERNPTLVAMEAEIRRAEAAVALARRSAIPDFTIGIETDLRPGIPIITPQLSITLPLWRDKIAAEIHSALAAREAAHARYTQEQLSLATEFASMAFMYRESVREYRLLVDRLLPRANDSRNVAAGGYVGGRSSFIDLLEAQRAVLQFELALVEARKAREIALLNLSLLIAGITSIEPGEFSHDRDAQ